MRARVVAPLVAAVLGIGGGVATALVVPDDDEADGTSTFNDPLHLGIPLVDQDCTGESLLVVGYGNSVAPLGTAVANNGRKGVALPALRRVVRRRSSARRARRRRRTSSTSAPTRPSQEPCEMRMTPEHRGGLRHGAALRQRARWSSAPARCRAARRPSCSGSAWTEPAASRRSGSAPCRRCSTTTTRQEFPHRDHRRVRRARRSARVTEIQQEQPGVPTEPTACVDEATWRILTDRICRIYDY